MSATPRSALQRLLFGPPHFAEHEELQAFQHRFLIATALGAAACNLALIALFALTSAQQPFFAPTAGVWAAAAVAYLLLWSWLRVHPRQPQTGSLIMAALYACNVCIAGRIMPSDPLMPMWMLPLVIGCFILIGRLAGWVACAAALGASLWLLGRVDLTPYPHAVQTLWFATLASAFLGHTYVERFHYFFSRTDHYQQELLRLSTVDPLTGALNAAAYYAQCDAQLVLCQRLGLPYAVLFVDLDHFKRVNDTYGHAMGDEVLQKTTQVLRSCLRDCDLLGRVGGEEFSILLPNTTQDGSDTVAERIRQSVEQQRWECQGQPLRITASIGMAWNQAPVDGPQTFHAIQQQADRAMYDAKHAGRNRVACFTTASEPALH